MYQDWDSDQGSVSVVVLAVVAEWGCLPSSWAALQVVAVGTVVSVVEARLEVPCMVVGMGVPWEVDP